MWSFFSGLFSCSPSLRFDWRTNTENGIHDCLWLLIDGNHKGLNFSTYSQLIKGSGDHVITWTFNSSGKYPEAEVWSK